MKKKVMIGVGIVLLVAVVLMAVVFGGSKDDGDTVYLDAAKVKVESLESRIITNGTVQSKSSRTVDSEIGGEIIEVYVKEGQVVKAGDLLMKLDTTDLEEQIKKAEIAYAMDEINLEQLKSKGKDSFSTALKNAQISYDDAKDTYEKNKALFNAGVISQTELNNYKKSKDMAYNEYQSALKSYSGELDVSSIKVQELQMENSMIGLEALRADLKEADIVAPMDGTVTSLPVKAWDVIPPNSTVATIDDLTDMEVIFNISEYEIAKVDIGLPVTITGDGVKGKYTGSVSRIGSRAMQAQKGNAIETVVEAAVTIDGTQSDFLPNFTADLNIVTESKETATVVPYDAIVVDRDDVVYVHKIFEGKLKKIVVQRGIEGDLMLEVISEHLDDGDIIILNPQLDMEEGISVKPMGVDEE